MAAEWRMSKRRKICKDQSLDNDDDEGGSGLPLIIPSLFKSSSSSVRSQQNHVYFCDDINSQTAMSLCHELRNVELTNKLLSVSYNFPIQPIFLHLTTNGGEIHAAFSIVDCIKNLSVPVHTVVDGFVASAGTLVSLAGSKRYITQNSYMLLHELRSGVWGKMSSIEEEMENLKKIMEHITSYYTTNTKLSKRSLDKLLTKDVIWNADECISKGVIDEIYKA